MTNYLAPAAILAALAATASAPSERVAAAWGASVLQTRSDEPGVRGCLRKSWRLDPDLPRATRTARDALVRDPSAIAGVAAQAREAAPARRAEIELGIVSALDYLKCVDPSGYAALQDWLAAHPGEAVVADLQKALSAQASIGGAAASPSGASGLSSGASAALGEAGALAAAPFFGAGPLVSQH